MNRSRSADRSRLVQLARRFRELHSGELLVLPNAWDVATARVLGDAGYPAVATTSAAISAVLGYPDGEGTPEPEMFEANARIARAVPLPVSMDAEGGYGMSASDFAERLVDSGLVGCNLEDTAHDGSNPAGQSVKGLIEAGTHAGWLGEVREALDATGVPVVLNARVDVFLPTSGVPESARLEEAIARGRLYRAAGADCIYPIGLGDPDALAALVAAVGGPINANTTPELDLARLRDLHVARVSYGPRFHRAGLADFDRAVRGLVQYASTGTSVKPTA
jgi:2-methylisocitrate lyase-like PEP mutase family enzyme